MTSAAKMMLSFVAGAAAATLVAAQLRRQEAVRAESAASASPDQPPANPDSARIGTRADLGPSAPDASVSSPGPERNPDREQLQRDQIVTLQARVRELEQRAAAAAAAPKRDSRDEAPHRPKLHDFTDAKLQEMAQRCEVRFDLPHLGREPYHLSPDLGARLHLSEAEQQRVGTEVDKISRDVVAHVRAFYLEATGDAAGADALEPESMMREVLDKSPPAVVQAARAEIARERAGLPVSPAGTIAERYLRYITSVGDSLQHALEPALGGQHASEARDALAESQSFQSGCPH